MLAMLLSIGVFNGCEVDNPVDVKGGDSASNGEPDGSSNDNEREESSVEDSTDMKDNNSIVVVSQKGWYIKLSVESDTLQDEGTVFGYLEGASDEKDKYDSDALGSSGLYSTIYREDLGSTHYRSDYRSYAPTGEKSDTWIIEVHSGDKNANVTLSWDGITYVSKNDKGTFDEEHKTRSAELDLMRLIDVEDATVLSVLDNEMKISFSMNGNRERVFKWVLLQDGEAEPEAKPFEKI